jgi:hypothetical protein
VTQLAVGFKSGMSSGREQRTDGLWKHLGIGDFGTLRAVANLTGLNTGAGLELLFDRPSATSYIQSYDRELSVWRDLIINARSITLAPQAPGTLVLPAGSVGTAAIAAGAAQQLIASYFVASTWSANAPYNAWIETAIQTPVVTCSGALCRFEATINWTCSAVGAVYFALYADHAAWQYSLALDAIPVAANPRTTSFVFYGTPPAGSHSFSVALYFSAGTISLSGGAYSSLYVTEQKR